VEVVDDVEIDEVDVEVETGVDAEVEVDEAVVVDVDAGTEVVGGTRVVEDEVEVVDADVEEVDEVEVVDADVEEVVEVDVVVVGTVLPPSTSPMLISSATNVPRIAALKRFSVAGFPSAQSWATTTVVLIPNDRSDGTRKLQVVVASGAGRRAAR
jgi:hypothetical protein